MWHRRNLPDHAAQGGEVWLGFEMFGADLVWCLGLQHALAPSVVGSVEVAQQLFQGTMRGDVDVEHFAGDTAVEALDHAVG